MNVVGGIAYAGRRRIQQVKISLDNGKTWSPVELNPPLPRFAWTIWRYEWKAEKKGTYRLRVRSTDGRGILQESGTLFGRSFPDGTKEIQEIKVSVD